MERRVLRLLMLNVDLARRLEGDVCIGNRMVAHVWPLANPGRQLDVLPLAGNVQALYGGPDFPLNDVVGLGVWETVSPDVLDSVEKFYHERECLVKVSVCPLADCSLIQLLGERGYRVTGFSYRWVLDLAAWQSPLINADSRVDEVSSGCKDEWCRTVAALFATSTKPAYRGLGLQTALLDWRLRRGQEAGMSIATVETAPDNGSARNVQRMGFRLAYVTTQMELGVPQR